MPGGLGKRLPKGLRTSLVASFTSIPTISRSSPLHVHLLLQPWLFTGTFTVVSSTSCYVHAAPPTPAVEQVAAQESREVDVCVGLFDGSDSIDKSAGLVPTTLPINKTDIVRVGLVTAASLSSASLVHVFVCFLSCRDVGCTCLSVTSSQSRRGLMSLCFSR
jgi:hypothetical protein